MNMRLILVALLLPVGALADTEKAAAGAVFAAGKAAPVTKAYEAPNAASKVVGTQPNGTRLVFRRTMLGADGKVTWYYVAPPGRPAGWVSASEVAANRPGDPPQAKLITPVDSGLATERPTAAQTAAARGLSDSAKQYAEKKTELKDAVNQFLTLEKTVEDYFVDPHSSIDGSYPDVTVPERKKKAEEFKAALK